MATEAQSCLLLEGVGIWNQWRENNPADQIDLSQTDLRRARLGKANLCHVNLRSADLSGIYMRRAYASHADLRRAVLTQANAYKIDLSFSDLRRATLQRSNLRQANLEQARLCGANLFGAELCGAKLSGANLVNANLVGADLTGADLTGANLTGANLKGTNLNRATLTKAILFNADLTSVLWSDLSLAGAKFKNNKGLRPIDQVAIKKLGGQFIPFAQVRKSALCHLLVLRDMQGQRVFHLSAGIYRLGRDELVDIQIADQSVSRCHAILLRLNDESSDDYFYRLVDGDGKGNLSQNGVRVNKHRCSFHNLNSGDLVTLGRTTLEYQVQEFTKRQLEEYMELMSRPGIPSAPDLSIRSTKLTL